MQLSLWTYEGPPHVGAMRIATAMRGVHYVLHAPQGDTYADLLFTMIERLPRRPPVTYTTFQARDLGGDTASLFQEAARAAWERFSPEALLVGASCTAELIQDDPGGLAEAIGLPVPVVPLELPSYQRKENWGAAETFYQLVRRFARRIERAPLDGTRPARCNLLGPTALGFRHRDDVREVRALLEALGVEVGVVAPLDASPADLARLGEADFNVTMYPEVAGPAVQWLSRSLGLPFTRTVPIGVGATRQFLREAAALAGVDPEPVLAAIGSRATWYARSVDSTYLSGKRVFVFGDATHAIAAARVASQELGFDVVGLGTYSRELAREVREAAAAHGLEALITDDALEVETRIAELQPDLVLGTQMERHVAKRLGLPCAVISAPVHVQDFPARHSPQMGFEGAAVLFDTWVHPLMMGLEEHLLAMFRDDVEFHEGAAPSHLPRTAAATAPRPAAVAPPAPALAVPSGPDAVVAAPVTAAPAPTPTAAMAAAPADAAPTPAVAAAVPAAREPAPAPADDPIAPRAAGPADATAGWTDEALRELQKVPFFVRGKARRNTERYARERGVGLITLETLYDAKAHFGR